MSTTQYANVQHPVDHKAAKAANAEVKKEIHENQMHDPDQPLGTRVKAAAKVPGDKMEAEGHKQSYTSTGVPVGPGSHTVHPTTGVVPAVGVATHGAYNPPGVVTHPTTAPGVGGHPLTAPGVVHPTTGVVHPTTGVVHPTTGVVHPTTGVATGVVGPTTYGLNQPTTHYGAGHQDPVHHPKAAEAEAKKEIHYAQAKDQDETAGTRVKAAIKVPGDKVKEALHAATPGKHHGVDPLQPEGSTNYQGHPTHGVDTIATPGVVYPAAPYPGGPSANIQDPALHPKAVKAEAKKELHEAQAQDPNAKAGTRAKAAVKIPGDKAKEAGHKVKPEKHYPVNHANPTAVYPTTTTGVVHPTTGVVHPTTGVVHPTTGVATGVHGDPTQYSVHPHTTTGVVHPTTGVVHGAGATVPGVGYQTHPVVEGKVHDPAHPKKTKAEKAEAKKEIHKAEAKLEHNHHPAGSTTYAGHPTATPTTTKHTEHGTKLADGSVKLQEAELKKEAHKQEAGDSNNSMGERIKAAVKVPVDAVQVKVAEHKAEKETK